MVNIEELIEKISKSNDINPLQLLNIDDDNRKVLEQRRNEEITKYNRKFYQFIPYLNEFTVGKLLTQGSRINVDAENWYDLVTNIYLRNPSGALLEALIDEARTNLYALKCIEIISLKRPDIIELPMVIKQIKSSVIQNTNSDTNLNLKNKNIIYFKLISGLIVKIDKNNFTAYRFNKETNEWQEDSVLFTEYEHGNLDGKEFDTIEHYPYGEPFHYGRYL